MLNLDHAIKALKASEDKAKELGTTVSTAIVDEHGTLIAFYRMDGALNISPAFAQAKAKTSSAFGLPSGDIAAYAVEGKPYFGLNTALGGEFMVIAGGVPVKHDNQIVGAVGVGGSMDVSQDLECAKAAAQVLEQAEK